MSEFESVEEELKFMADMADSMGDPEDSAMFMRYLARIRTLAAQRDEGLAREAELRSALQGMLEYFPEGYSDGEHFSIETAKAALAFRGCADQEQPS
jgi:hypothetical protein